MVLVLVDNSSMFHKDSPFNRFRQMLNVWKSSEFCPKIDKSLLNFNRNDISHIFNDILQRFSQQKPLKLQTFSLSFSENQKKTPFQNKIMFFKDFSSLSRKT